jgi:hypothetical protein
MNFLKSKGFVSAACVVTTSVAFCSQAVGANLERGSQYGANVSQSENTSRLSEGRSRAIAQLFYPPVGPSSVLRVIGKGRVVRAADKAELSFEFGSTVGEEGGSVEPPALQFRSLSKDKTPKTVSYTKQKVLLTVLTESSFQPILKALTAVGVPEQQVQVKFNGAKSSSSALPFPVPSKKRELSEFCVNQALKNVFALIQTLNTQNSEHSQKNGFRGNNSSAAGQSYASETCQDCRGRSGGCYTA